MTDKIKIGVDIDEVVLEFFERYLILFNKKFNTNFKLNDITNYHFWEITGVPKQDCLDLAHEMHVSENQNNVSLVEGVEDAIFKLKKDYNVYFITSRPEKYRDVMTKTLRTIFTNLKFKIFFSSGVWGVAKTKGELCNELGITVMVEDNADYALTCAKAGVKTFLLDKPWNQEYEPNKNLIKVKNWPEILERLE